MTPRRFYVAGIVAGIALGLAWWLIAKAWKALAVAVLAVIILR